MKKHTKIYYDHFDYCVDDFVQCEICGKRAVDIHHIKSRGMGGSYNQDRIENLMALCREHHLLLGDKKQYLDFLKMVHLDYMDCRIPFEVEFGKKITQLYIDNPKFKMI